MSFLVYTNVPISVPRVKDTTPCLETMLEYEDCVYDAQSKHLEVYHPNWPSMWPRLLTDGKIGPDQIYIDPVSEEEVDLTENFPLSNKEKQYLWECEAERFTFKGCLRRVIGMERSGRHTSWNTAEVANLQFT